MHIQSKRGKSDVAFVKGANERNEFFEKINSYVLRSSPDEKGKILTISGTN